jgi:hypothetical protein
MSGSYDRTCTACAGGLQECCEADDVETIVGGRKSKAKIADRIPMNRLRAETFRKREIWGATIVIDVIRKDEPLEVFVRDIPRRSYESLVEISQERRDETIYSRYRVSLVSPLLKPPAKAHRWPVARLYPPTNQQHHEATIPICPSCRFQRNPTHFSGLCGILLILQHPG